MSFSAEPRSPKPTTGTNMIIGIMVVAAFIMILNETIVSIAVPRFAEIFQISASTAQWLVSGFLVTMAVVIPTTGFLIDRLAPRTIFLTAVSLFSLGTALCAGALNFPLLLIGRIVQASGTAVMIPLVMTSVMRLVPAHKRGAMMGTISIVIGVAPAIGPTVGGAILAAFTWRWMFGIVLILAFILVTVGAVVLRVPSSPKSTPLDLVSVFLSATGFAGLVYGLSAIGQSEIEYLPWASLGISAVTLTGFIWRQQVLQRTDRPLLDLRTLRFTRFRLGVLMSVIVFMALLGAGAILLPIYLQDVLGHDTLTAGMSLLPGGLAMAAVSRPAGSLYDRVGIRPLLIPGAIGMALALWVFAFLGPLAPLPLVIGTHVLLMISLGTMMTPLMADALGALPDRLHSHGSAIFATLQQVAGAIGASVFVAVAALMSEVAGEIPDAPGLAAGFALAGCFGLLGVFVAFFFKNSGATPNLTNIDG